MRVRYSFSSRHTGKIDNINKQRKTYPKIVDEIIRTSDLILEVLDARFPEDTRNKELEEEIKKQGKALIYVMNKSDLVDVKEKEDKLPADMKPYIFISATNRLSTAKLRDFLKREVRKIDLPDNKNRYQVGIIGYPNTGKSSLINVLTGRSSAGTGAQAGFTKGMQKIRLTSDILILDTPGVIPDKDYSTTEQSKLSKHAKVSARDATRVKNPDLALAAIMKDYYKEIEEFYGIEANGDSEVLLDILGKQRGYLKKGGVSDDDRTARAVLRDFQLGNIQV